MKTGIARPHFEVLECIQADYTWSSINQVTSDN
jgi:hypothetical protein